MSSTLEVGKKLVDMCRKVQFKEAIDALYAPNIKSVEAHAGDGTMPRTLEGIEAIRGKTVWWLENHTVHSVGVEGPFPNEDRFVVFFKLDVTPKVGPMANKRFTMEEAALYTVKSGKVVHEEFFYDMGG